MFMNGKIKVLSKKLFDTMMHFRGINDETVETFADHAFISIRCSDNAIKQFDGKRTDVTAHHWFQSSHPNVLNIAFDDIGPKLKEENLTFTLFDETHAVQILDFWKKNRGKTWYIHCTAGKSRSGACGDFIRQIEGYDLETFQRDNPIVDPNGHILRILSEVYAESYS